MILKYLYLYFNCFIGFPANICDPWLVELVYAQPADMECPPYMKHVNMGTSTRYNGKALEERQARRYRLESLYFPCLFD